MKLVRRRHDWLLLGLVAASLALAYAFGKVGSEVLEGEMARVDYGLRAWMQAHRSPAADAIFRIITVFGAKELLAPAAALIGWRLFRGTKQLIALLAFSALAAGEFVAILKRNFHVVRPAGGITAGLGFSFPSGHATGSMAVAIVLSWIAIRRRVRPRTMVATSAALVLLVGVSRVYLDVHWPSDVVGGWIVGAAFGIGCCALYEWLLRRDAGHSEQSEESAAPQVDPSLRSG